MFIKEKSRIISGFLVVLLLLSTLFSCQVEVEGSPAQEVLRSASVKKWDSGALESDDYSQSELSASALYDGTEALRIKSLVMALDTASYEGFELVQCDFSIISDTDIDAVIECYSIIDGAAAQLCGSATVELTANEACAVELPIYNGNTVRRQQTVEYELRFSPVLPFSDELEADALEEAIDFAAWVIIEYKISNMLFYGAQTTAT